MADYLPSELLKYLEGEPLIYEYHALFGYLRGLLSSNEGSKPTKLALCSASGRPLPLLGNRLAVGFLCNHRWYLHGAICYLPPGYDCIEADEIVRQLLVYLVSYDTRFTWQNISMVLASLEGSNGFLAAARAAASIGNFPLTCRISQDLATYGKFHLKSLVPAVASAAIDVKFAHLLAKRYGLNDAYLSCPERSVVHALALRDDLEMIQFFFPRGLVTYFMHELIRQASEAFEGKMVHYLSEMLRKAQGLEKGTECDEASD